MNKKGKRKITRRASRKKVVGEEKEAFFLTELQRWFQKNERELPWRKTKEPYAIWVSEIILQQTQVSRGIGYYERFLDRFPDIFSLSSARWPSVLKEWRGLGYYSRAKNMLKTAKLLVQEFDGEFPDDQKQLTQLPGVGPYTASAIRSFAFGKNTPAIDTNLKRVFQRVFGCPTSQIDERAQALFERKPRSSRKLNYALMDLGATVCVSRSPKCHECPLSSCCDYALQERLTSTTAKVKKKKRPALPSIDVAVGCIHRDGSYLLGRRPKRKGGRWEFPGGKREKGESIRAALKREIQEELGVEVSVRPAFLVESFSDESYEWRLHFCRCQILSGKERALEHDEIQWISKEDLKNFDMPSSNQAAVGRLEKMR